MRINTKNQERTKSEILLKILSVIITIFWVIILFTQIFAVINKKVFYPLKYQEEISEYSKEFGVDMALVYATIKVESNFNEKAVSDKNAIGLMQIKKETGEYIATLLGDKDFDLLDKKTNIRYGTFYLKYLSEKFTNFNAMVCAYNAGEGKVTEWLKDNSKSKDGVSLTSIPYKETENYLTRINKCYKKYKKLYSKILDKQDNIE